MYGLNVVGSSINLMIDNGFSALTLIYKGAAHDSSYWLPNIGFIFTKAVTVISNTTPVFFGLAYDKGRSLTVAPIAMQRSGNSYTMHYIERAQGDFDFNTFLTNPTYEYYVFSSDMPVNDSKYGISIRGENGKEVFNSSIKPLQPIGSANVYPSFQLHTTVSLQYNMFRDISSKKIAVSFAPAGWNLYLSSHKYYGLTPTIQINNNNSLGCAFHVHILLGKNASILEFWKNFTAWTQGRPMYVLAIDVTDL